jgi:glutaredoxin-like protein
MSDTITMYGADWCSDCRRSKKLLDGMGVEYEYIDVERQEHAADEARAISGRTNIPVIAFPDGTHFTEPSDAELRAKIEALLAV